MRHPAPRLSQRHTRSSKAWQHVVRSCLVMASIDENDIEHGANAPNPGHCSRREAEFPAATASAHAESPGPNYLSVQSMSASLPGVVVPSMGIDAGFFSTNYSLGRASSRNGGNILVEAEPGGFHHVGKDVFDTVNSTASRRGARLLHVVGLQGGAVPARPVLRGAPFRRDWSAADSGAGRRPAPVDHLYACVTPSRPWRREPTRSHARAQATEQRRCGTRRSPSGAAASPADERVLQVQARFTPERPHGAVPSNPLPPSSRLASGRTCSPVPADL